jgi:hypothetical protein
MAKRKALRLVTPADCREAWSQMAKGRSLYAVAKSLGVHPIGLDIAIWSGRWRASLD